MIIFFTIKKGKLSMKKVNLQYLLTIKQLFVESMRILPKQRPLDFRISSKHLPAQNQH